MNKSQSRVSEMEDGGKYRHINRQLQHELWDEKHSEILFTEGGSRMNQELFPCEWDI